MPRKSGPRGPYGFKIEDEKMILELHNQGKSTNFIANVIGCTRHKIRNFYEKNNMSPNISGHSEEVCEKVETTKFTIDDQRQIMDLYISGQSITHIAYTIKCCIQDVIKFLEEETELLKPSYKPKDKLQYFNTVIQDQETNLLERIESLEMQIELLHNIIKEMKDDNTKNNRL
jgi:hypothetical protein